MKKPFVQAVILIAASIVLALVSNAVASRQRKLVLPGYYPNALEVPKHDTTPPAPIIATTAPATTVSTTTGHGSPVTGTVSPETQTPPRPVTRDQRPPDQRPPEQRPPAKPAAPKIDIAAKFQPHPDKPYVEVAWADAAALHAAGVLVLDARRSSVFEQGHIAGARPFSVWESDVDDKVNKLYEERNDPRDQLKPVLIYCSGGDCEDSHMLAQKLWGIQFNNIYVYKDGYPDWVKRGGPIRTGTNP